MARSHAKIKCSIWRDPDWLALSPEARAVYHFVLEQQRLSLVGSIDLALSRWAGLTGYHRAVVEAAVCELEAARWLVVDWTTDEVLVRTFTTHDIDTNRVNVNLAKGLWGQWGLIESPALRSVAVHEMPEELWVKLEQHAPDDAVQNRMSARLEPESRPRSEPEGDAPVADGEIESRLEPPPSSHLSPVTVQRPDEAIPVQADFDHHPVPKIHPEQQRSNLAAIRSIKPQGGDAA